MLPRRNLGRVLTTAAAARIAADRLDAAETQPRKLNPPPGYVVMKMGGLQHFVPPQPEKIAMLIYPGMTALDLIGPQQAFGYMMGAKVDLVSKTREPVVTDTGVTVTPTAAFEARADILAATTQMYTPLMKSARASADTASARWGI